MAYNRLLQKLPKVPPVLRDIAEASYTDKKRRNGMREKQEIMCLREMNSGGNIYIYLKKREQKLINHTSFLPISAARKKKSQAGKCVLYDFICLDYEKIVGVSVWTVSLCLMGG